MAKCLWEHMNKITPLKHIQYKWNGVILIKAGFISGLRDYTALVLALVLAGRT